MRRRLLTILLLLAAIAVTCFAVPFAQAIATGRTRELVLERTRDADRFAAMSTSNKNKLCPQAQRFHDLYGEDLVLVDAMGRVRCNTGVHLQDRTVRTALSEAGANELPGPAIDSLRPWGPAHILVTRHWGDPEQMRGAVLLVVNTAGARADIGAGWCGILAGALIALGASTVLALGLAQWILRPLDRLSHVVSELTAALPTPRGDNRPIEDAQNGPPEIRALARSVDTLALTVADSVDAQRQLVADTAHAMRNPLAALAIRLESLEPAVRGEAEVNFQGSVREVHRLTALLDGLLALAVAETPTDSQLGRAGTGTDSDTAGCDALLAAADRVDAWHSAFAKAGRTLRLDTPAPTAETAFPQSALIQILDVALSNSCRYAGDGASTTVLIRREPGAVTVSVTDDGTGVPAADIARLTERFFRGRGAAAGGSGLGLTIAAALAHRHGATLLLEPADPRGLRLILCMPLAGTAFADTATTRSPAGRGSEPCAR
ncbi:signal transduction histidine kinase [Nocardia sp. GAS34]|uniref:sensor histidine kinase n=1 Tax=unclassified Nocardia TaxID=2637762 RepID=UPI003D24F50E